MSISYTATGIIITDGRNPDREPLVLPVGTPNHEVDAAVVGYLGAPVIPPNYVGFYNALLGSSCYQAVLNQPATAELARAMVVFVSAIQDCMAGRENRQAMQGAIWILLSQIELLPEHAVELSTLLAQHYLAGVYQLTP